MGLSVCAENLYPYENNKSQQLDGTVQQTGNNDVIIVNTKRKSGGNVFTDVKNTITDFRVKAAIRSMNLETQPDLSKYPTEDIRNAVLDIIELNDYTEWDKMYPPTRGDLRNRAKAERSRIAQEEYLREKRQADAFASAILSRGNIQINNSSSTSGTSSVTITRDPFVIPIDGKYYVMVKDKTGGTWGPEDLLGYTDPKNDKFRSLRALESDNKYAQLTGEEIKKAGVRLVLLNENNVLLVKERDKDYDLSKINYIDMLNLKVTANGKDTGVFGHFNVYLKTAKPKMVTGFVTFDTESKLKILFE